MRVLPIRYCVDIEGLDPVLPGARAGARRRHPARQLGRAAGRGRHPALHRTSEHGGECELAFEADEPLEAVAARLAEAGFPADPIVDESYGRSLRVRDPDGVYVQVNENDRTLYT
jgi:hypothetical protein